MHPEFWHQRWATNQIGFHEAVANPMLVKHFSKLQLLKESRVFLPLCGKTLDIGWLLAQGYQVVGAELSKLAIDQLFQELKIEPVVTSSGNLERYQAHHIDIFVGDIFDLTPPILGKVDAIYDRAALVALPLDMRTRYARHLVDITHTAPQLLICFDYDQSLVDGPPFSVTAEEVKSQYAAAYNLSLLETVATKVKGQFEARETAWLLTGPSHNN